MTNVPSGRSAHGRGWNRRRCVPGTSRSPCSRRFISPGAGARILVDRLWPRGLKKDDAALDAWCKDIAPSTELRTWYGHDPARFPEFTERYRTELEAPAGAANLAALRRLHDERALTLLTATKALDLSHARVLADFLSTSHAAPP